MKRRDITCIFAIGAVAFATAIAASAQVIIRGTESSDKTASQSVTIVSAPGRDVMALTKDTQESALDANTKRTESVTQARLPQGNTFESGRSVTIKKDLSPDKSVSSTDVTKKDPQGQDRVVRHTDETVSKSAMGETAQSKVYTRNTKGELVLDHVVDANTVKGSDGAVNTTRVEKIADVNGNLTFKKQIEEVAVDRSPNEKVVTAKTRKVDHLTGELAVTAEETSSITTQGNTKQTESEVRTPGRLGWEATTRSTTTETTAPDGSVRRETVEQSRSIYSTKSGNQMLEPLVPQRKIVEQEVRKPDGTTVLQRDVFVRDVNGDWKPESFSTKDMGKGVPGQN